MTASTATPTLAQVWETFRRGFVTTLTRAEIDTYWENYRELYLDDPEELNHQDAMFQAIALADGTERFYEPFEDWCENYNAETRTQFLAQFQDHPRGGLSGRDDSRIQTLWEDLDDSEKMIMRLFEYAESIPNAFGIE